MQLKLTKKLHGLTIAFGDLAIGFKAAKRHLVLDKVRRG